LQPLDDQATEELRRLPIGKAVYVELKAARNPRQHRLLFGLLKALTDNTDLFPSVDSALVAMKIGTGLVDMSVVDGQTVMIPRSISFANMDQAAFSTWFDDAIRLVSTRWLKVAPEALRREIEEMIA
jgi:hypothetical protein